jgi:cell filamentation protein
LGRPGGPGLQQWNLIEDAWREIKTYVHDRDYLVGADRAAFVEEATNVYNAVNTVHTFREGNGRTQRE